MGFSNHLLYCLWILTNTQIAAAASVLPGWVGMERKIDTMAGFRFKESGSRPDIGTRPSH